MAGGYLHTPRPDTFQPENAHTHILERYHAIPPIVITHSLGRGEAHDTLGAPNTDMGDKVGYTHTSRTFVQASPNGELIDTTTPEATCADNTTSINNIALATIGVAAILAADVYAADAANPTTRASPTEPAAITKATTRDEGEK